MSVRGDHAASAYDAWMTALATVLALLVPFGAPPPTTQPGPTTRPAVVEEKDPNPPVPGFDVAGSDPAAIRIADRTMAAMGGRAAWDRTRFISWWFFDRRFHLWDRKTNDIRVEGFDGQEKWVVLMNLDSQEGRAWLGGDEVVNSELAKQMVNEAYQAWVNDSYWLFMPYKLKDAGVTLKLVGRRETAAGMPADVVELTFSEVGVTPQNKYHVYVGVASGLVEQWDFFRAAADTEPAISTPWTDWRRYGEIMLSRSRGKRGLGPIRVVQELPTSAFKSPDEVTLPPEPPAAAEEPPVV